MRSVEARVSSSAATLAWSEPLTALLRSAQSRVSSSRSLCKAACEDTLASPFHGIVSCVLLKVRVRSHACGNLPICRVSKEARAEWHLSFRSTSRLSSFFGISRGKSEGTGRRRLKRATKETSDLPAEPAVALWAPPELALSP